MTCDVLLVDPVRTGTLTQEKLYYLVEAKRTS
jgi:hypothetical protein